MTAIRRPPWLLSLTLLVLVVAAAVGSLAASPATSDWPAPRHDSANTGVNPTVAAPTTDVGPGWTARVGTGGWGDVGPTVADGTVYIGNSEGVLFAFDATSGDRDWRRDLGGSVESAAVLDATRAHVFVRDLDSDIVELVAVDRTDGEVAWRFTPAFDRPHPTFRGHPVVVDGAVVASGGAFGPDVEPRRFVVAVDEGAERWRYDVGEHGVTSPAVAGDRVYVGTYDPETETGHVVALDAADGAVEWQTPLTSQPAGAPVVTGSEVYVATWSDVTVLDASDGAVDRHLDVVAGGEAIAVANDTVYAVRWDDDAVVALDATSGETRWTANESSVETAPVVARNAVVVGSSDGVVGLDPATGLRLWYYGLGERVGVGSQLAVVDGAVYVGPTDHRLYALVEGGSAVPRDLLGQFGDAIGSDAFLGALAAIATASLVAGVVAGGVVLGVARALGFSWVTPRLLAARVLRRPYETVGRWAMVAVHFLLAVLVLVVAGAGYLGGAILLSVFGPSGPSLLGGGLPIVGGLLLLVAVTAWGVFAYRWLPSASAVEDVSIRTLRRQAAVVLVTYAVVAGVLYPLLLFVSLMLVFFR